MAEYIKKSDAVEMAHCIPVASRKRYSALGMNFWYEGAEDAREQIAEGLSEAPTADVVEVVRCMACERGRPTEYATDTVWCTCLRQDMELDDFCSYGKKER